MSAMAPPSKEEVCNELIEIVKLLTMDLSERMNHMYEEITALHGKFITETNDRLTKLESDYSESNDRHNLVTARLESLQDKVEKISDRMLK